MKEYEGIDLSKSKEIAYWLENYCHDKSPLVLKNDLVLQKMVRKYHLKRKIKILIFNISIWIIFIFIANELTKGA